MGYEEKTIGGGPATGLAETFTSFLQQLITGGSFGPGKSGSNPQDTINKLRNPTGNKMADKANSQIAGKMETRGGVGSGSAASQYNNEDPMADSAGIFGLLNSIISNPQADQSVQDLISKDSERGRNDLRSRFGASGGMAFGSPAAYAESLYQAEQAPRTAVAMDQMAQGRLGALMPFFQMIMNLSGKGIAQAETTMQPNGLMQGFNTVMDVANTVGNFIPGSPGGGGTNARNASFIPLPNTGLPTA